MNDKDLDEKLKAVAIQILKSGNQLYDDYTVNDFGRLESWEQAQVNNSVAQIKAAFKEALYEPPETRWVGRRYDVFVKTGQEWYDKFMESAPKQLTTADKLDFNLHDNDPEGNCYYAYNCAVAEVKKAARRAAGLEDAE